MKTEDKVVKNQPNFKEKFNRIDSRIDDCKKNISFNANVNESNISFLRKLDANIPEENELISIIKKSVIENDNSITKNQKNLKDLYDERYELEKEEREYYRKEYEGYKEAKSKETDKQADDGRVGE